MSVNESQNKGGRFLPTRWSLVLQLDSADEARSQEALGELCQRYWKPVYGFIRDRGRSLEDCEDLTQGFFLDLIRKKKFSEAREDKGKLRTFLLKILKDFLASDYQKSIAAKRGAGDQPLSIDFTNEEGKAIWEPPDESSNPEQMYHKRWALTVLERALERLDQFYPDGEEERRRFQHFRPFLIQEGEQSYKELGEQLEMSVGAVKVAIFRLKKEFRDLCISELEDTLGPGESLDEELETILSALSPD